MASKRALRCDIEVGEVSVALEAGGENRRERDLIERRNPQRVEDGTAIERCLRERMPPSHMRQRGVQSKRVVGAIVAALTSSSHPARCPFCSRIGSGVANTPHPTRGYGRSDSSPRRLTCPTIGNNRQCGREREVLRHSAIAAGLVWSAPTVRSVSRLAATGSPAPTTTATTTTSTQVSFVGPVPRTLLGPGTGACFGAIGSAAFNVTTELSSLGQCTLAFDMCLFEGQTNDVLIGAGTFLITAAGGAIGGSIDPGVIRSVPPLPSDQPMQFDMTITSGTNQFVGATGTAELSARRRRVHLTMW